MWSFNVLCHFLELGFHILSSFVWYVLLQNSIFKIANCDQNTVCFPLVIWSCIGVADNNSTFRSSILARLPFWEEIFAWSPFWEDCQQVFSPGFWLVQIIHTWNGRAFLHIKPHLYNIHKGDLLHYRLTISAVSRESICLASTVFLTSKPSPSSCT